MRGIGPATASLILAVYDPQNVPFFSDELFRWLHWEDAKNKGWDRSIKYSLKEYKQLLERMGELRERLKEDGGDAEEVSAEDIEKAAYNIAKNPLKSVPEDEEDEESSLALMPPSPKPKKTAQKKRKRGGDIEVDEDASKKGVVRRKGRNDSAR